MEPDDVWQSSAVLVDERGGGDGIADVDPRRWSRGLARLRAIVGRVQNMNEKVAMLQPNHLIQPLAGERSTAPTRVMMVR